MLKESKINYFDVDLLYPKVSFFSKKIIKKQHFSFGKLNHAFWQMFFKDDSCWYDNFVKMHGLDFLEEFISLIPDIKNYIGVSLTGPPSIENLTNLEPKKSMFIISDIFKGKELFYGQLWKVYFLNYSIKSFLDIIRKNKNPLIVVGMKHLIKINNFLKIDDFNFIEIKSNASFYRNELVQQIKSNIKDDSIIFYQSGEMLSSWLIYQFYGMNIYQIDMGRTLDVFSSGIYDKKIVDIMPDVNSQIWMNGINVKEFL